MKVILFADNDRDFVEARSEFLETKGYTVLKAFSPGEARNILNHRRVHLAILDIRLTDDTDGDISGVELALEATYDPLPKIMLTGFPTVETAKLTLKRRVNRLPAAVDYVPKRGEGEKKGSEVLIEVVEQAFDQYVCINQDLNIRWGRQNELLSPHLASQIYPDLSREWLTERTGELEDLFRKLFYEYGQVTLGRILTRREGWILLTAFAYPVQRPEEQFIVAYGQREKVQQEAKHYRSFVPDRAGEKVVSLAKFAETIHFGATAYRLVGGEVEKVTTFVDFYHRQPGDKVLAAVKDLFHVALQPWYEKGQEKQPRPLEIFCRERVESEGKALTQPELEKRVNDVCRAALTAGIRGLDCSPHKLTFRPSKGTVISYPNPAPYLYEQRIVLSPPTLCGVTHGRLDGASVLVDRTGQTWVVDFEKTGIGPLIRDFVSLETSVKFDILREADLSKRHELERRLLAMGHLGEEIGTKGLDPAGGKALQTIGQIRSQAAAVVGSEMEPYWVGLLFCAAERLLDYQSELRYTREEMAIFAHILLSAGMMCQQLVGGEDCLPDASPEAVESLWIDIENQEVWVEGRRIHLPPQGFCLLQYLYDHANQLCKRSDIAKSVFNMDYPDFRPGERKLTDKDTINTAIRRLRKAIEPNPSYPKYIRTIRGAGYKLVLGHTPSRDET